MWHNLLKPSEVLETLDEKKKGRVHDNALPLIILSLMVAKVPPTEWFEFGVVASLLILSVRSRN